MATSLSPNIPNITFGFDMISVNTDIIGGTRKNGLLKGVIHTELLGSGSKIPGHDFEYHPKFVIWVDVKVRTLDKMRIWLTDEFGRIYQLNNQPIQLMLMITDENGSSQF